MHTHALLQVIALESAGSGVTCNAVCPGYVDTPSKHSKILKQLLSYTSTCTLIEIEIMRWPNTFCLQCIPTLHTEFVAVLQSQVKALAQSENISLNEARHKFLGNFHATGKPVGIDHVCIRSPQS